MGCSCSVALFKCTKGLLTNALPSTLQIRYVTRAPQEGAKSNLTASLDLRAGGFELEEAASCDAGFGALETGLGSAIED